MAPARKNKSVNKKYSSIHEVSPDKDTRNSSKSKPKKKLADKLGPQWTKADIECFYKAYREYGKDWKKVAAAVRNRSTEMVEALYIMNQAYLSLPDGIVSEAGLVAMMTDHYSVLGGSDYERESNKHSEMPQKVQNHKQDKLYLESSNEHVFQPQSTASSQGCLALLRRADHNGNYPRVVKKRTPRVPVSYSYMRDDADNCILSNKRVLNSEANDTDDEDVAARTLTGALEKQDYPKVSHTPNKKAECREPSPVHHYNRMLPQSVTTKALCDSSNECSMEGRCGCSEPVIATYTKQLSPCSQRKRSGKKLVFRDERSSVDALLTLADLSLSMLPTSVMESETSVKFKKDEIKHGSDKYSVPEAASTTHQRDKAKNLGRKEKFLCLTTRIEEPTSRKLNNSIEEPISKKLKVGSMDNNVVFETKQQSESTNNSWKRKHKASSSKISNAEAPIDSPFRQSFDNENMLEEENNNLAQGKCGAQPSRWKSYRVSEGFATNGDPESAGVDSVVSASLPKPVNFPTKHQSRRKKMLQRTLLSVEKNSSKYTIKDHINKQSLTQDRLMEKLSTCLSSNLARRWCCFEWFCGAIDFAWFDKREFEEYLNHVGLGHIPRLTRVEWGVIKSSLGKPRRFSECFLHEERKKLKLYRESVRKHYSEFRMGTGKGLPTDLARPISVGQQVIAIHPSTREVHNGKVLTVDHDRCRVQFDNPEQGVEFVMDIDCMPLNPLENMPEAFRRNLASDKLAPKQTELNGHSDIGGSMVFTPNRRVDSVTSPLNMPENQIQRNNLPVKEDVPIVITGHQAVYGHPLTMAHIHSREADIQAASELNHALDKKASSGLLYPTNPLSHCQKPLTNSSFFGSLTSSVDSSLVLPEPASSVGEIIKYSRLKAEAMVDAAIKAMSSLKEGEDAYMRIGEALDSIYKIDLRGQEIGSLDYPNHLVSCTSKPAAAEKIDEPVPSELITSCVATLLMIQTCTERQYAPADVAQVIDSAVKCLHPCYPQNVSIYRDIQTSMNRILYQILALIPA